MFFIHSRKRWTNFHPQNGHVLIQIFRLRKQWNQPTRRCIHLRPNSLTGAGGFNFLVFIPAKVIPNMIRFFQLGWWKNHQMDYVYGWFFPVVSKKDKSIDTQIIINRWSINRNHQLLTVSLVDPEVLGWKCWVSGKGRFQLSTDPFDTIWLGDYIGDGILPSYNRGLFHKLFKKDSRH